MMPSGVGPMLAREIVETAEEATRWATGGPPT